MSSIVQADYKDIFQKIQLFSEYDPSIYFSDSQYSWIASGTIEAYHIDCQNILNEKYDAIAGDLAAIDSNDESSIELGPIDEDEFVMQPEDLSTYLIQGLTYEKDVADSLFGKYTFDNITLEVISGGDTIKLNFETKVVLNTDIHPFPFTEMTLDITIQLEYWQSNYYRNGTMPSTIEIKDMYRGPADNIGDRGTNYYDPIDISTASIDGLEATNYLKREGSIWDFDDQTVEVNATFDNGATAIFELNIPLTIDFNAGKITSVVPVVSNGTYLDFQGSIIQPKYQWSDFTSTQSPNTLRAIEALQTSAISPKTELFIEAICDSIDDVWPNVEDALENAENFDSDAIIALVKSDLYANKAVAQAQDLSSIKRYAKTYLANRVFEASVSYALNLLGISTTPSLTMTVAQLSDLNDELVDVGVSNFAEASGYYNWSNIPNCNSKDESARFATAIFTNIKDFDTMLLHPALEWISNNFDFIESEIISAEEQLNKVI